MQNVSRWIWTCLIETILNDNNYSQMKLKLDHTNKWYMYNPEPVLHNEKLKLLVDFQIDADHLISARWPDVIMINIKKENL